MGRTLPTFNTYLLEEQAHWRPFRRALRAEHQPAFDRLFTRARAHVAEATCMARPVPFEALLMTILLEHEMEIEALKAQIARQRPIVLQPQEFTVTPVASEH